MDHTFATYSSVVPRSETAWKTKTLISSFDASGVLQYSRFQALQSLDIRHEAQGWTDDLKGTYALCPTEVSSMTRLKALKVLVCLLNIPSFSYYKFTHNLWVTICHKAAFCTSIGRSSARACAKKLASSCCIPCKPSLSLMMISSEPVSFLLLYSDDDLCRKHPSRKIHRLA